MFGIRTIGAACAIGCLIMGSLAASGCGDGSGPEGPMPEDFECSPLPPSEREACVEPEEATIFRSLEEVYALCDSTCKTLGSIDMIAAKERNNFGEMESLAPFQGFVHAEAITLTRMPGLSDMSGLEDLKSMGGLRLRDMQSLTNLNGTDNLTHIENYLNLRGHQELESLQGLETLESMGKGMTITLDGNAKLNSLSALSGVDREEGRATGHKIRILDNDSLETLEGLEWVEDFSGGQISIVRNDSLRSLEGLQNLTKVQNLDIDDNPRLPTCKAQALADRVEVTESVSIENNGSEAPDGACSN